MIPVNLTQNSDSSVDHTGRTYEWNVSTILSVRLFGTLVVARSAGSRLGPASALPSWPFVPTKGSADEPFVAVSAGPDVSTCSSTSSSSHLTKTTGNSYFDQLQPYFNMRFEELTNARGPAKHILTRLIPDLHRKHTALLARQKTLTIISFGQLNSFPPRHVASTSKHKKALHGCFPNAFGESPCGL